MKDKKSTSYGSPNSIVLSYFACIRRLIRDGISHTDKDQQKETAALTILMAVCAIEAFLNIWFRTFSEVGSFSQHRNMIINDLKSKKGILYKIRNWPKKYFGKSLDFSTGSGRAFLNLIDRRNALMHFTTDCESVKLPGIVLNGLVDLSPYTSLTIEDAANALTICENLIKDFFLLQGYSEGRTIIQLHQWIGRVPSSREAELIRAEQRGGI